MKYCYGKLADYSMKTSSSGKPTLTLNIETSVYDVKTKQYSKLSRNILYCDNEKNKSATALNKSVDKMKGKFVLMGYEEKEYSGKTFCFGMTFPTFHGMLQFKEEYPATISAPDTEAMQRALIPLTTVGAIPDGYEPVPGDKESIDEFRTTLTDLLQDSDTNTVDAAKTALNALTAYHTPERYVYIGYLGNIEEKTSGKGTKYARISAALPEKQGNNEADKKAEWVNATAFSKTAERACKALQKGDTVVLFMDDPNEYNGKVSYRLVNFERLYRKPADKAN